jgi:antitoxin component HigA of HigAB toxin-antitoxin module
VRYQLLITECVVDEQETLIQPNKVLDTDELLARLLDRGIKNVEIAKALGLPDSRIPEIKDKRRALKLDEAVKLVRAFGLEQDFRADPLPASVMRLAVQYVASELGVRLPNQQLEDLSEDVRAFFEFVADPKVQQSVEAAEMFFQAMRLRRPRPVEAAPPGNDL